MSLGSALDDAAKEGYRRVRQFVHPAGAAAPNAGATTKPAEVISSAVPAKQSDDTALMADDDPEGLSQPYTEEEIRELAARTALTGRPLDDMLKEIEAAFQSWSGDKKASETIFVSHLDEQKDLLLTLRKDLADAQIEAGPMQIELAGQRTILQKSKRTIRELVKSKLRSVPAARELKSKRDHEQAVQKAEEQWQRGAPARQLRLAEIDTTCRDLEAALLRSAAQAESFIGRGLHFFPGAMLLIVALFSIPGLAGAAAALFTNDAPARDIMREGALAVGQNFGLGPQSLVAWTISGLLCVICAGIAFRAHDKAGITVAWWQASTNRSLYVAAVVDVYQHGYERGQKVAGGRISLYERVMEIWGEGLI